MTPAQIKLARHALGLPNRRRQSYRNRYFAGEGSFAYIEWCKMIEDGVARGVKLSHGNPVFWLTRQGAELALKPGESLDPGDFPKTEN